MVLLADSRSNRGLIELLLSSLEGVQNAANISRYMRPLGSENHVRIFLHLSNERSNVSTIAKIIGKTNQEVLL